MVGYSHVGELWSFVNRKLAVSLQRALFSLLPLWLNSLVNHLVALRDRMGDGRDSIFTRSRFVLVWDTSFAPDFFVSITF